MREAAEGAVADLVAHLEPRSRLEVLRGDAEHLPADVVAVERVDVEAIEKRAGRRDALLLVIERSDAAVDELRRRRLAEIVADRAEHHRELLRPRQIVDARARPIDHLQVVHPDVAFGMPLRLLRTAGERLQLGKQLRDHAEIHREREADRRPSARTAASRTRPRRARPADRRAGSRGTARARRRLEREAEARGELHARAARAGCRRRRSADRRRAAGAARDRARPSNGSKYSPVSGSQEIALTVKSRRRAASAIDMSGSPVTTKPRWPRPAFESRRGSETSMSPIL